MTDLLARMIAIPSPSREEAAVADFLERWLAAEGLAPHRHGNNLWCVRGSGPVVLLDAHIDTVRPASGWTRDPFTPMVEDGRLYGLGANDDGGSVVTLIEAFRRLENPACTFVLSLSAEEEVSGRGGLESVLPVIEAAVGPIRFGLMGEPTGMQMAVSERGLMVLDCTAHGRAGHAARGEGVNAIYEALPDILWFRDHGMNVTQVEAGTQHNVIPDRCRFVVDVRTSGSNAALLEEIRAAVRCDVAARSTRLNGSSIREDHPFVRRGKALGLGTFASPTLSNQALCPFPTVKIGPGDSARSHTADEYIRLDELSGAVDLYLQLLDGFTL